ncbi:MAG: T9SS type A sorting domain-containing protein [Bacteroidia bacterium]|nr:T9SS type A sorting domain-containing protein [Bacteroidia bacterium]
MKKTLLTIFAAIFSSVAMLGQAPPQRNCGTMQHHQYLQQTRPNYSNELNQYNQMIDQYLADKATGKINSPSVIITIPVVVHVVYNTATPASSITIARAASQVQVLNDDFAKLNADAIKVTQPTFSTVASGAQIRFCLAQRDPNGNATTGVDYKSTTVASFSTNDAVKSATTGGANAWDVTKYVNIWVCDLGTQLLGYGEFPTGNLSNTWGLVLHYKYTGTGAGAVAPYNLGRTGTHEFGHCFNLLHIWGDDGTACSGSDQCADTPNQAGEHYGCFTAGSIQTDACSPNSPGTMWMNYMDYTDDACMYMFTANQVARMEAVVNTAPWNVLANSLGCTPVSALDAGISSVIDPVNGSSTCNNSITPKITLSNTGSTTITTAKVLYKMDALATQTLNWSGSLAAGASTVLTLNVYAGLTNAAHTFSASVTAPNAGIDGNSLNNSLSSTFTVISAPVGSALPFTERFDAVTFPPTGWVKTSANVTDATATWTRLANTTGIPVVPTTTACAKMNNFAGNIDITGQKDALRTPALNLSGSNSTLRVVFDRSHRIYSTADIDTLNIYISTDCGGTWTRLYTKGGAQLATVTGTLSTAYTPTSNAQWVRDSVSLTSYVGQASVYLKFESRSGWGNNLYLDNINVKYTAAAAPPVAGFTTSATKCVGSSVTVSDASTNLPTSWTWTFPGGTPATSTAQNPTVTYTAAGTYTITHTAANASGTSTPISSTISISANPTVAVSSATVCRGTAASLIASGATTYSWNTGASTASISVTPTITTNYTVSGTNAAGCANTKTLSVTVNATPTVVANSTTVCAGSAANITATGATTYSWNTGATTSSISVTPATATNYTVIGTTNGCTNTKIVSVTVSAAPSILVNSQSICAGASATLTASGATTYTWNTNSNSASIVVSPAATTNYTVAGNLAGCTIGAVQTATVTVTPLPNVTLGAISGPLCVTNAPVVLSGSPAGGVFSGVGVSGSSFDPAVSGAGTFVISYNYTDANLCSATATQTVSVSLCTGIIELNSTSVSVYPNPAENSINVLMDASLVNNASIELYDAIGKLIITEKVLNTNTAIFINHLSKGIYTLRVVSNGNQTAKRIIKE